MQEDYLSRFFAVYQKYLHQDYSQITSEDFVHILRGLSDEIQINQTKIDNLRDSYKILCKIFKQIKKDLPK